MNQNLEICIVTYPIALAGVMPLSNLINCLSKLSSSIYLITGNYGENVLNMLSNIHGYSIDFKPMSFLLIEILRHLMLQIRIAYHILKVNKKADLYVYYMGESLVLPSFVCKLLRKPIVWIMAGSVVKIFENNPGLASKLFLIETKINYKLADKIVIYSKKLIKEWKLEKYQAKILLAHKHYLDFDKFNIFKQLAQRDIMVGYIGRFSDEKGVLNLIRAIPQILQIRDEIKFVVGGDGQQKSEIDKYLAENDLHDKVVLSGWISHDNLPSYLNQLKLLVLPSYTEGLPNIMLEAMACGTPVLSTSVGAITDFIKDEDTGFIMENNTPDCIAENILRALNHANLERISQNARSLIESQFTYEKSTENYKNVLLNLGI